MCLKGAITLEAPGFRWYAHVFVSELVTRLTISGDDMPCNWNIAWGQRLDLGFWYKSRHIRDCVVDDGKSSSPEPLIFCCDRPHCYPDRTHRYA